METTVADEEMERYRELVRRKDPATMEKRRLASLCPVCGARLIDGAHRRLIDGGQPHTTDEADHAD
jgi:hypothetical protein